MFYSLLATNSSSNVVDRLNGAEKIYTTIESQNGMSSIGKHSAIFPGLNFLCTWKLCHIQCDEQWF